MLFICHDLALIRSFAHQIAVMYLGNIVEVIPGEDVTEYAVHPYTQALLGAQFSIHMDPSQKIQSIESEAPSPLDVPKGCPFQNRCEHCTDRCKAEMPKLKEIAPGHEAACFYVEEHLKIEGKGEGVMKRKFISLTLSAVLVLGVTTPAWAAAETYTDGEAHTIGVIVYDPDASEMEMFSDYYRDYIQAGFPVKFIFSGRTTSAEDEIQYIDKMKEQGAEGIISFAGFAAGIQDIIGECEKEEVYYALGSNTISDENYEAVKDNSCYMGSVGPKLEDVYQSGCDMTEYFLDKGAKNFVIMSGGASSGNRLHQVRTWGMLNTLEEKAGLVLTEEAETLSTTEEVTKLSSEDGSVQVTICPGYTEQDGPGLDNLSTAFADGNCDALMSAFHVSTYLDKIADKEKNRTAIFW